MTGVKNGFPLLEDGTVLTVSNVIWCTGFRPNFDWIDFSLPTHNGLPIHDRGIVESCPGVYFIGLLFLYSLSSALVGGVGRDAEQIVDHIVSTQLSRREDAVARATTTSGPRAENAVTRSSINLLKRVDRLARSGPRRPQSSRS